MQCFCSWNLQMQGVKQFTEVYNNIVIKWPKDPAGIQHLHCLIITQPTTFGQAGQSIQSSSFLSDVSNFMEESRWEYILKIKHLTVISMQLAISSYSVIKSHVSTRSIYISSRSKLNLGEIFLSFKWYRILYTRVGDNRILRINVK